MSERYSDESSMNGLKKGIGTEASWMLRKYWPLVLNTWRHVSEWWPVSLDRTWVKSEVVVRSSPHSFIHPCLFNFDCGTTYNTDIIYNNDNNYMLCLFAYNAVFICIGRWTRLAHVDWIFRFQRLFLTVVFLLYSGVSLIAEATFLLSQKRKLLKWIDGSFLCLTIGSTAKR